MVDDGHGPGSRKLARREFLVAGAATGIAVAGPINYVALARGKHLPDAREVKFAHGVAAGFPTDRAITLWTRLSELQRTSRLTLEVATDKHFRHVVKRERVVAKRHSDFTVHERVSGLRPAEEYFYRFETSKSESRVGRFRTLPPKNSKQPLKLAFYSCQDYEAGYYNAHAALAKEDLDVCVFLGDYVYEHMYYDGPSDRVDRSGPNKDGDVQTLPEYRQKYHLYQSDPDLQDLQAAHAFVSVWDDHEVEDNYAGDGADSKQKDPNFENDGKTPRRVTVEQRRRNGYKAFFEAMPRIRMRGEEKNNIYGSVRLGGMAELFLTDQRQFRDPQPCDDALAQPCPDDDTPGRTMLGAEQKAWFKRAVPASSAKWKLWGSEVMVMALDLPKGQHANPDQWDGYGAERREILESFVAAGVKNLTVLTGDIHTFLAGDLTTNGESEGTPVGVELVGGSLTSLGIPEALNVPGPTLKALVPTADPHIKFSDFDRRGYCVLTVDAKELNAEFMQCDALTKGAKPQSLAKFKVESGVPKLNVV